MRILVLHNLYQQPGGEDVVFAAEIALLRRYKHGVFEYVEDNKRAGEMRHWDVAVQAIWSHSSKRKLQELLFHIRPQVAHFHNTFLLISPSAYWACHAVGVPVVQTLHNYRLLCPAATFSRNGRVCEDCLEKTLLWPGVVHRCWRDSRTQTAVAAAMLIIHRRLRTWQEQVDIYIALTEFARQKFIEGGLPADKIVVKPNFVDSDPGMREGLGRYALFVGRLSPEKGIGTLLAAWKRLKSVPLKVVGDGPLMGRVQRSVREDGVEEVDILGRGLHGEVLKTMKDARFLVFPSGCYENFPLAIAEAFACGVPVIASRLGAMAEIVEDGRTGLLFTPGDPEDLAAKVEWAWTHPKDVETMGREARREYEEKYTVERNYEMLMEIYRRAMEKTAI